MIYNYIILFILSNLYYNNYDMYLLYKYKIILYYFFTIRGLSSMYDKLKIKINT